MANLIVGDIQGCYDGLKALLEKADFNPKKDKLWAVGDLIGRGNQAQQTLDYLVSLENSFESVLGNHDLHFLAVCAGIRKDKPQDKFRALLQHNRLDDYVNWLRVRPLATLVNDNSLICHAGLYPQWSFEQALTISAQISEKLQGKRWQKMLSSMYGNMPNTWSNKHLDEDKVRFAINALTRMRYVTKHLALEFDTKTSPDQAPSNLTPWFQIKNPKLLKKQRVVFGHWAALNGLFAHPRFTGLDTGYIWGESLTLMHWEKQQRISVKAK